MWLFGDHGRLIKRYNPNSLKLDFSVLSSDVTVYNELLRKNARIVKVTSMVVPVMGIAYIGISLLVVIINIQNVPAMFVRIFEEAFDFRAIFGAFSGSAMMQGIRRGLYSNEAGIGSAPNASASANVSHPVKQGLVQMLSVFIDTLLLCTATAMMCMSSGIDPAKELQGAPWVQASLQESLGSFMGSFRCTDGGYGTH